MAEEQKTSRKMRSITSTFSLRDVAVVAVAAFTAAGPFFAYDTRISVVESKVQANEESKLEIKDRLKSLESEFSLHLREYRDEMAARDARNQSENPRLPVPAPTNK